MKENKKNKPFSWFNFVDILDSSKIGLWSIEIDNNTGINRMYCNDTMLKLLGATDYFSPEKSFEFWYSRIHKGYYSYVEKAIEQVCTSNKAIEIQYPWQHPKLGDIIVRCSGKLSSIDNGVITIKGYHQNINDLHQMNVVLSKTENEIFEWYQDSNTAYVHTHYSQLYKEQSNVENFPEIWIKNGNVQKYFKDVYLDAFERINNGNKKAICELKMKNKNGEYTWFKMTLSKEEVSSELSNVVIGTLENINSLKEMEIAYVIQSRFYKAILKEMVAYGEVNITNKKFLRVGGSWSIYNRVIDNFTVEELLEKNINKLIYPEDREDYLKTLNCENLMKLHKEGESIIKYEFRKIIGKESIRWLELTISLFQEPYKKDILALLYLRDIDNKKKEEMALKYETEIDDLTGLFNKKHLIKNIDETFKQCNKNDEFCMLLLDVDEFKNINYLGGNILGDEVLKYIASLIKYIFDENSILSRISSDKFIIFLKNIDKETINNKICELYLRIKDFSEVNISLSIGAFVSKKSTYLHMYNICDKAIYKIKNSKIKNMICWGKGDNANSDLVLEKPFNENFLQKSTKSDKTYYTMEELLSNEGNEIAYVIDAFDYKLIDGNNSFFELLNKPKEQCIGIECYKLIHNRQTPCSLCKNIFWNYSDFFVWNQYNKILKKDFLLKNKLVSFKDKKCMFTIGTSVSLIDNIQNKDVNTEINRSILSAITHLSKKYNYENNIKFILELVCTLYKSEFGFIFEINKDNNLSSYNLTNNNLNEEIKQSLEQIILDEFLYSPINKIKYLSSEQEAISLSYNLYDFMRKYHLYNILIIPIINNEKYIGYILCINNDKLEDSIYYEKLEEYSSNISYFIGEEIIKNSLKKELNLEKNYDSLTGVLNRNAYRNYEKAYDPDNVKYIGILCLALNELNNINHTAGIAAGDQIILDLADILKTQFYHKPIFRLNGNEFLIIMENINYDSFLQEIDILSKSLEKIGLSMTYGKAWSEDEKELNHLVNSAIYFRKMESNKSKQLINNNNLYKRNSLFSELMISIESKEFEIFLQPKIALENNKLYGAEALIRKRNLEGGYIPPDKFIPILEHHYLIQYIDLFVFEEVLKLLQSWKNENKPLIPISLNFSRRTLLEEDIIKMVLDIKNKYDIDYKYVEIEITESIGDLEKKAICTVLKDIKNMGISILLDDFGVKYSNLSILSEIAFDGLKLDKTMVRNLGENITNEVIMKNIICMCKDLSIKTTAEGVETNEQENILKTMHCDIIQGYLHSKPLPVTEFIQNFYEPSKSD
nr:EAL domain-containing protein [uncultured Tyzzerella sp.]